MWGAGAAGTELAFGYKKRWSTLFGQDIKTTLISSHSTVLEGAHPTTIAQAERKLKENHIDVIYNQKAKEIQKDGVIF